jgi:hypothetical protein
MWGVTKNDLWVGGSVSRQVPPAGDASAGTTATDPLLLHWDGSAWTRVELPIAAGNGSRVVTSIWGSAANDVWAVGRTDASADTWHFDGSGWTEVPVAGAPSLEQVWGTCAGDFWAVSAYGGFARQYWHYDGRAWSLVQLPQGIRPDPGAAVTGTGPGDVWVSVQTEPTSTPYQQGPYRLVAHWGPNRCGDGVVAGAETCDPSRTSGDGLRCDSSCRRPRCGNGVTDPGEDCDPPNQGDGLQCDESCHRPICGNGVVDAGEECDPPKAGFCDRQCRNVAPACGDGVTQSGEQCDFSDPHQYLCKADCTWSCINHCRLYPTRFDKTVCDSVSGPAAAQCLVLLGCMINYYCAGSAGTGPTMPTTAMGCLLCGNEPCTADGPCAAEARALLATIAPALDTTDSQVLVDETDFGAGLLKAITNEAAYTNSAPSTNCRLYICATGI